MGGSNLDSGGSEVSDLHLTKQPNSRSCFACGLENPRGLSLVFYNVGKERVETEYTAPEHFQGYPGILHGGIVASLLDEVVGRTAMIEDPNHFMVTARLSVRYRKPIPVGVPLKLTGWMVRKRGRLGTAEAELRLPDGTLGAEAEAILADHELSGQGEDLFESLGWRVYPD